LVTKERTTPLLAMKLWMLFTTLATPILLTWLNCQKMYLFIYCQNFPSPSLALSSFSIKIQLHTQSQSEPTANNKVMKRWMCGWTEKHFFIGLQFHS
jgi:hypothetical protein